MFCGTSKGLSRVYVEAVFLLVTVAAAAVFYATFYGNFAGMEESVGVQVVSAAMVLDGSRVRITVTVKNIGTVAVDGVFVEGVDDSGKMFKLALPPPDVGQSTSATLIIPTNVNNLVLDASGNNRHGRLYYGEWVEGKTGFGLKFNGTDGGVTVPCPYLVYNKTVFAWINRIGSSRATLWTVDDSDWGYRGWAFALTQSNPYFRIGDGVGGENKISSQTVPSDVWTFLAARYNRIFNQVEFFVDQSKSTQYTFTRTPVQYFNTANFGGEDINDNEVGLNGVIDQVCVYDRLLSDQEILLTQKNPSIVVTRGLVAWYPMDEGTPLAFKFTVGKTYTLTVKAYTLTGSVTTKMFEVVCS
ncbi:MAG: LamG-like jellyroll fold domain-containing protein [Candidatus Bathyarchaeia archaeon]